MLGAGQHCWLSFWVDSRPRAIARVLLTVRERRGGVGVSGKQQVLNKQALCRCCMSPLQVVSFHETLKCIAKVVEGVDISIDHPPPVGYAHEWYAAILIQKIVRGKLHRNAVAAKLARGEAKGVVSKSRLGALGRSVAPLALGPAPSFRRKQPAVANVEVSSSSGDLPPQHSQ